MGPGRATPPPASSPLARRHRLGVELGAVVVLAAGLLDVLLQRRDFPLTAVLVGPLLASGFATPGGVLAVGALGLAVTGAVVASENLPGVAGPSRLAVVAITSVGSAVVAFIRTRHERALAEAHRAAAQSLALQRGLLPDLRGTADVEVRALYRPQSRDLLVGGDFVDVVELPGRRVAFCVGDVTGHDPVAAGLGAGLRAAWRTLALSGADPAAWLAALDDFVRADAAEDRLATVCAGILDAGERALTVVNAGHPRPVLLTDRAEALDVEPGPPLGVPPDLSGGWRSATLALPGAYALLLYTDGLVEGRRSPADASRYGEASLTRWLARAGAGAAIAEADLRLLVRDAEAANGGPLSDDVALVVLAGRGVPGRPGGPATRQRAGPARPGGAALHGGADYR